MQAYLHCPAVPVMPPTPLMLSSGCAYSCHKIMIKVYRIIAKSMKLYWHYAFTLHLCGLWQHVVLSVGTSASERYSASNFSVGINKQAG